MGGYPRAVGENPYAPLPTEHGLEPFNIRAVVADHVSKPWPAVLATWTVERGRAHRVGHGRGAGTDHVAPLRRDINGRDQHRLCHVAGCDRLPQAITEGTFELS